LEVTFFTNAFAAATLPLTFTTASS
jgi:hypothetical protein